MAQSQQPVSQDEYLLQHLYQTLRDDALGPILRFQHDDDYRDLPPYDVTRDALHCNKMIDLLSIIILDGKPWDHNMMLTQGIPQGSMMYDLFGAGARRQDLPPTNDITELASRLEAELHHALQWNVPTGARARELSAAAKKLREALIAARAAAVRKGGGGDGATNAAAAALPANVPMANASSSNGGGGTGSQQGQEQKKKKKKKNASQPAQAQAQANAQQHPQPQSSSPHSVIPPVRSVSPSSGRPPLPPGGSAAAELRQRSSSNNKHNHDERPSRRHRRQPPPPPPLSRKQQQQGGLDAEGQGGTFQPFIYVAVALFAIYVLNTEGLESFLIMVVAFVVIAGIYRHLLREFGG